MTKVGLLEVSDPHAQMGWVLRIRIEDSLSDRLPEDEPIPEGEEDIDLAAFNTEFIVHGSGTAFVNVDAQSQSEVTVRRWLCKLTAGETSPNLISRDARYFEFDKAFTSPGKRSPDIYGAACIFNDHDGKAFTPGVFSRVADTKV